MDKFEKKAYPLFLRILYLCMIITLFIILVIGIVNSVFFSVFIIISYSILAVVVLIVCCLIIKYRPFSAIVTLDNAGIRFKSKVADYFMPWEMIGKVIVYEYGELETMVIFIDKTFNGEIHSLNIWKTSNSKMYIYKYKGLLEFIDSHWSGKIIHNVKPVKKRR